MDLFVQELTKDKEWAGDYPQTSYVTVPLIEKIDLNWKCFNDEPLKDVMLMLIEFLSLQTTDDNETKTTAETTSPLKKFRADA